VSSPSGGWDASYQREEAAPWDIGRPQPVFEALAAQGRLIGDLLDAGCGTGEHTLLAASYGADAFGVDASPVAIERARQKAVGRGLTARFASGDILRMPLPPAGFDTVLDCGLFHVFDDTARAHYVDVLARVLRPGGSYLLMCFSDQQPGDWGPRRVTRDELVDAFSTGWAIETIEPAVFDINALPEASSVCAWLAVFSRG
jgi:SAM-dependent methyltransferase